MDSINFTRQLVKGRIAETVFAQMLRSTNKFTVLEFGYEKIVPELVQYGYENIVSGGAIDTLRTAPDFAIINRESKQVQLVEVKYRKTLRSDDMLKCAQKMHESWNPSYLFIATKEGFYFDEITTIIKNKGEIATLEHPFIPRKLQNEYLQVIQDFESEN